jgi:hypothetical protein
MIGRYRNQAEYNQCNPNDSGALLLFIGVFLFLISILLVVL